MELAKVLLEDGPIMDWLATVPVNDFSGQCCRDTFINKYLADDPIEMICEPQGTSKWHQHKKYRVSGSRIHSIYTASKNMSTNWEKKSTDYFWPKKFSGPATQYGLKTESLAKKAYEQFFEVTVENFGFIVSPQNRWMGFSPDGIIFDKNGRPKKLVEIKCPVLGEEKPLEEVLPTLKRYLNCKDGTYFLRKCEYYSQITLGMVMANVEVCDFVVYTKFDDRFWVEEVLLDIKYAETLLSTVKQSFLNYMLHQICIDEKKKEDNEIGGICIAENDENEYDDESGDELINSLFDGK